VKVNIQKGEDKDIVSNFFDIVFLNCEANVVALRYFATIEIGKQCCKCKLSNLHLQPINRT
jgi:hypothetical protein